MAGLEHYSWLCFYFFQPSCIIITLVGALQYMKMVSMGVRGCGMRSHTILYTPT